MNKLFYWWIFSRYIFKQYHCLYVCTENVCKLHSVTLIHLNMKCVYYYRKYQVWRIKFRSWWIHKISYIQRRWIASSSTIVEIVYLYYIPKTEVIPLTYFWFSCCYLITKNIQVLGNSIKYISFVVKCVQNHSSK